MSAVAIAGAVIGAWVVGMGCGAGFCLLIGSMVVKQASAMASARRPGVKIGEGAGQVHNDKGRVGETASAILNADDPKRRRVIHHQH